MTAYLVVSRLLTEAEPECEESFGNPNKKHHPTKEAFDTFLHFEVMIYPKGDLIDVVFWVI